MFFSIIIPVYNRPQEVDELLASLVQQQYKSFEVLVVEDGSQEDAEEIVNSYIGQLDIRYFRKPNEGQGFARNYGFSQARGDYFVVFDSDCLIPSNYLEVVQNRLKVDFLDAYGGPDAAHPSFTATQKSISYAMTSPFTTGGIRGGKHHVGAFQLRSFNMGISRRVWEATGGFRWANRSEDMEFSLRIQQHGFKTGLIITAVVYHKRRTDFFQFFRQIYGFGQGRIRLFAHTPSKLKLMHFFPALFTLGLAGLTILNVFLLFDFFNIPIAFFLNGLTRLGNSLLLIFSFLLFFHALFQFRKFRVAILSVFAAFVQLIAYGSGFIVDLGKYILLRNR